MAVEKHGRAKRVAGMLYEQTTDRDENTRSWLCRSGEEWFHVASTANLQESFDKIRAANTVPGTGTDCIPARLNLLNGNRLSG